LKAQVGNVVAMGMLRATEELKIIAIRYDELLSETQCGAPPVMGRSR